MFAIAPSAYLNQLKPLVQSRTSNWESWIQISSKSVHIFYSFVTETFVTIISIQMLVRIETIIGNERVIVLASMLHGRAQCDTNSDAYSAE